MFKNYILPSTRLTVLTSFLSALITGCIQYDCIAHICLFFQLLNNCQALIGLFM